MRESSYRIRSLTDQLNLLIRRFTLLSVIFILLIFIIFGVATYHDTAHLEEMLDAVELGEENWENVVRHVDEIIRKETFNRDIT